MTPKSKVVVLPLPPPLLLPKPEKESISIAEEKPTPHPLTWLMKWRCAACDRFNYPSSYKCFACNAARVGALVSSRMPSRQVTSIAAVGRAKIAKQPLTEVLRSFVDADVPVVPLVSILSKQAASQLEVPGASTCGYDASCGCAAFYASLLRSMQQVAGTGRVSGNVLR